MEPAHGGYLSRQPVTGDGSKNDRCVSESDKIVTNQDILRLLHEFAAVRERFGENLDDALDSQPLQCLNHIGGEKPRKVEEFRNEQPVSTNTDNNLVESADQNLQESFYERYDHKNSTAEAMRNSNHSFLTAHAVIGQSNYVSQWEDDNKQVHTNGGDDERVHREEDEDKEVHREDGGGGIDDNEEEEVLIDQKELDKLMATLCMQVEFLQQVGAGNKVLKDVEDILDCAAMKMLHCFIEDRGVAEGNVARDSDTTLMGINDHGKPLLHLTMVMGEAATAVGTVAAGVPLAVTHVKMDNEGVSGDEFGSCYYPTEQRFEIHLGLSSWIKQGVG